MEEIKKTNISIIISSFSRLPLFIKSFETIRHQLIEGDELVIVEDGKNTEWQKFLNDYKVKYQYVKTNNKEYRSGCMAKNIALKLARNPIVVINDPEVMHLTPCITQIKEHLAKYPDSFVTAGDAYFGKQEGDTYGSQSGHIWHSQAPFVAGVYKENLVRIGGWDERFKFWGNDDNDLMHRLGLSGTHHMVNDEMSFFHQWHQRPPARAMGDYNEPLLYEENKNIIANEGKEWGKLKPYYEYYTN